MIHWDGDLPARINAILFDLDGTLVDTAPDLAATLNAMRQSRGLDDIAEHELRPQSSHGTQGLLRLGFSLDTLHPDFPALRREFLERYTANLVVRSKVFDGMAEVLDALDKRTIKWGVVTNKPARLTQPLLAGLGLLERAAFVVSGDTCAYAKPHPAPVLHACQLAKVTPERCLYVGDAERDIQAANAAGMPALVAMYGYLGSDDRPDAWGARGRIDSPLELLDWLADGDN